MNKIISVIDKDHILPIIILSILFLIQLINLDSDPSPLKNIGDMSDEGYWVHNARLRYLFGSFLIDDLNIAYWGSPLFNLLVYVSYKLFYPSLFSARLISIASLWIILTILFLLIKNNYSFYLAVFTVIFIGFMHEMLMFSKWATPIILEIACEIMIIFFWELGKKGNIRYLFMAGAFFPFALLGKLSAIYFGIPLTLFILGTYFIKQELNWQELILFLSGLICAFIMVFFGFYLPNYDQYMVFKRLIAESNINSYSFNLRSIILNPLLYYPSTAICSVLLFFYILESSLKIPKNGFKNYIKDMTSLEYFSWCWLIGSGLIITLANYRPERRYVSLIFPMAILVSIYTYNSFKLQKDMMMSHKKINKKLFKYVCFVLLSYFIYRLFNMVISEIEFEWLRLIGLNLSYKNIIVLVLAVSISYLYVIKQNRKQVIILMLSIFFIVNLTLNSVWYLGASFTLRDASRKIGDYTSAQIYKITGCQAHWLAMENRTFPIWYVITDSNFSKDINTQFLNDIQLIDFILIEEELREGVPTEFEKKLPYGKLRYLRLNDFKTHKTKLLGELKLCPFPFTSKYRSECKLYIIYCD